MTHFIQPGKRYNLKEKYKYILIFYLEEYTPSVKSKIPEATL
jgi:hypothetical protein